MSNLQKKTISVSYTLIEDVNDLVNNEKFLVQKASEAMRHSYSPYSKFSVGCAIQLSDGTIIKASNQENASFGLTVCAERNALFAAGSAGKKDQVRTIAITGSPKDKIGQVVPIEQENIISPCGACRQVMKEYEDLSGQKTVIMFLTTAGRVYRMEGVDTLLPFAFGPNNLK